ncbi:hypothetical protein COO60DRAFT_70863 [Scenedesmus sp. NREL 46B-D3]|nr:hypothetical protein COO60DRAFT_70863 [Scenedesmus sp. NREL 46B-D3]
MRRVIHGAPNAALMSMAIVAFVSQTRTARNGESIKLPYPWFATGEDMHGMLARRYGVPLVSVRDALYDVMWDDAALKSALGYGRAKIMVDHIHPTFIGHDLYGRGLVAWAMRYIFSRELSVLSTSLPPSHDDNAAGYSATEIAAGRAQHNNDNSNHRVTNQPRKPFGSGSDSLLPQPVSPVAASEADGDPFCAEGAWFRDYAVKGSVTEHGWEWVDGTTPLNLQYCRYFNCHRLGYRAEGVTKSLDVLVRTVLCPTGQPAWKIVSSMVSASFIRLSCVHTR